MRIALCASMGFAQEIFDVKDILEGKGHNIHTPNDTEDITKFIDGRVKEEDKMMDGKADYMKVYNHTISRMDAILVLNYPKNDIPNYIGANTLIEMSMAYVQEKGLFLLNPVPEMPYIKDEVIFMKPVVIHGDFDKIPL